MATTLLQRALNSTPAPYDELPPTLQGILYPLPLSTLVDQEAARYRVDPLFLAALVRQESLWNPSAVSFAGALGLTQVMPATGADIARSLGIEPFSPLSLLEPPRGIQFGAYYISLQLESLLSPAAALAAYNGGHTNAIRWASIHNPEDDPAAYLEAITFTETHSYVELVLTGYARYRALAASE